MMNESLLTLHYAQSILDIEEDRTKIDRGDYDLVVDCTHYSGSRVKEVPNNIQCRLWEMANGFGQCSLQYIANKLEWDWSHNRDSDSEAIRKMANFLRENGFR